MSHKTIAIVAVIMIFVFGTIVVVYPTAFQPAEANKTLNAPEPMLPSAQKN